MSDLDPNLPKLSLEGDDLATLTAISYDKIRTASGGVLSDFRAGSPLSALVEGQVFALSELLYYANLLPEATALEVFNLYGVKRSLGTPAVGYLTFQLAAISNIDFVLPVGYAFPYLNGNLVLTAPLYIPAGALRSTAAVKMDVEGSIYNAGSYGVVITSTGLAGLQAVYNEEPLAGGSDIESISDCIARMQRTINTRMVLVNNNDYELAAQEILGVGSRAICVPKLAADKRTLAFGYVALFLLNKNGLPATTEQTRQVQLALSERGVIGTVLSVFPMEVFEVDVEVYIQTDTINPAISQAIFDVLRNYLNPSTYNGGYKIRYNELAYLARQVNGCTSVESVLINGNAIDKLLPNSYTMPVLGECVVSQASADGFSSENVYTVSDKLDPD